MAWKDTLLDATFRGVPFACEGIARSGQRSIAVHEYPYTAGADLEDLNISARRVKLQAVFFGDNYEQELYQFITALEEPGVAELVHPIHGSMMVLAEAWEDDHNAEMVDGAVVSVNFVEDSVRTLVFNAESTSARTDAIVSSADAARGAADDALSRFLDGSGFSLGSLGIEIPRLTVLKDAFNQAKGFLGRALSITGSAGLLLADLDPLLYPRAYCADLLATVDRAFQGLPFGGRNATYSGPTPRAITSVSAIGDFNQALVQFQPATVVLAPAVPVATPVMHADLAVVQAHARVHSAAAVSEAAAIVLAGEADAPLLSRTDIEQLTAQTRAAVQVAIDGARAALDAEASGQICAALATLAWAVQEAARAVINQRPPLVRRASPVEGPVRLVAHAMYGAPDRATELSALNQFGRRVFIDKGQQLYAYAR